MSDQGSTSDYLSHAAGPTPNRQRSYDLMWTSKVYLISWRYFRAAATLNQMARAARSRDSLFAWFPLNVFVVIRSSWAVPMQFCFLFFFNFGFCQGQTTGILWLPSAQRIKHFESVTESGPCRSKWSMLIWKCESTRKNLENFKVDLYCRCHKYNKGQFSSPQQHRYTKF